MNMSDPPPHSDGQYPFLLTQGRVLYQSDRNFIEKSEVVEIHHADAHAMGVSEGDLVEVVSSKERIRGTARISRLHTGMISVTSLFGDLASSLDQTDNPDPMLKVPGLPVVPVRVDKVD